MKARDQDNKEENQSNGEAPLPAVSANTASSWHWPFAAFAQAPAKRTRIAYLAGSLPTRSVNVIGAFIEGFLFGSSAHIDMPATPQRVWSAIHDARKRSAAR